MPAHVDWGRREYPASLEAMRRLRAERRRGTIGDTLILVEHPPVVTVGVEGDDGEAITSGLPVIRVERGGKSTYHGPGQLVGYPIVDLDARGRDVRRFVHKLEEMLVKSVAEFGIVAGHVSGRRGVWVEGERKIASIGIAVEQWVTFHGFALNVDVDLAPFSMFHPCGFDGRIMTSIARETGRPVSVEEAKGPVLRAWAATFGVGGMPVPSDVVSSAGAPAV
ncbi:lipoate biosynthesis protein B Lipoate-protein ligase B [mine drainage metagenome]|uniref:lipoyl(octanoyl) transferase n=1 Tax=mine drainage metagenome TaxID=410659 RepID=T1AZT3_9ZZZZ